MNLHGIVGPFVAAVNPQIPVALRISTGPAQTTAAGKQVPGYATPGALTASIAGGVLTVAAVSQGFLDVGQALSGAGLLPGVVIGSQITGVPGGTGTYRLAGPPQPDVAGEAMTTSLTVLGQVQPITTRDLMQLEGVNLGGIKWKVYLNGALNGIVRPENKGGDMVTISQGPHQGVWLTVAVLEQWPDWCVAAIVQQNGS